MQISVNNYADFVTVVKSVGRIDAVFFWDGTGASSNFRIYAAFGAGGCCASIVQESEPGTFSSDFPDAVEVSSPISIQEYN
jgi:hypothetical protein